MAVPQLGRMTWSGTARRLAFAFGSLILLFGISAWLAMRSFDEVGLALHGMHGREERVRTALELATAVRDQYAHQAHTIIIGDESHMGFYAEAFGRVLELTRKVREGGDAQERQEASEIEASTKKLDEVFKKRIVPAVLSGELEDIHMQHEEAQEIVSDIQERVDGLVHRYEAEMQQLDLDAAKVEAATHRWVVVLAAWALLMSLAVGAYIVRSVAVPVAKLQAGAMKLAEGDLEVVIALDGEDEFGTLARQFNAMTASIKEHQKKLLQSERLAAVGKLAAGVAHEINNPLGVILGYLKLLKRKSQGQCERELRVIEDESLRCKNIVEDLLDLSSTPQVPARDVNLRALCEEVAARLRETPAGREVALEVVGDGLAQGNAAKLQQVILNLLKNAAEASGPGGKVQVEVSGSPRSATVSVADSGKGVAPDAMDRIFEPFFTTKSSGTGLGLAVSQAIVRAHRGRLEVCNREGAGAVFTLWLPRAVEENS